jgi:hypothetical protein
MLQISIVLSRFEYDGFPNFVFTPGPFRLEVRGQTSQQNPLDENEEEAWKIEAHHVS